MRKVFKILENLLYLIMQGIKIEYKNDFLAHSPQGLTHNCLRELDGLLSI